MMKISNNRVMLRRTDEGQMKGLTRLVEGPAKVGNHKFRM